MIQPRCEGDDEQSASQRPSSSVPTMLKALLRERHLQNYGMFKRAYQKAARGLDKDLADTYPSVQTFRRWLAGKVKTLPHAEHCAVLEAMLPGWTAADLFRPYVAPGDRAGSTLLQELLRRRCIHDYRAFCRAYTIAATTIDKSLAGTHPAEPQFQRWICGDMVGLPYPDQCNVLEVMFPGYSARQLFGPYQDDSLPPAVLPAAVSTVLQPQPTQPCPSQDADRLGVPPGHEATASSPTPAGQRQTERITEVRTSGTFPASVTVELPAEGDTEIRDQLTNLLLREWVGMMNRRGVLQLPWWAATIVAALSVLSGLNADEQQRLARAVASPSRVDAQVIDNIETMLQHCKRREDALGPRAVLGTVLAEQGLVESLLTECPDALRPRLLSVSSDMSTSIGWYYFDLDDLESAMRHWDQARAAAQEAKNVEFSIYALGNMSYAASWHGKGHTAIDVAAAAQSLVSKTGDPLMRVCVATEAARACAIDGQHTACMIEYEKAQDALASAGQVSTESPAYWYHEGWLFGEKSDCLLQLGKPREAAAAARQALDLYDKSYVGSVATCTLRLGNACLQSDEVDETARVVGDAVSSVVQIRSTRLVKELHGTRARMQPWQDTRAVKELDDRLAAYGLASNTTTS